MRKFMELIKDTLVLGSNDFDKTEIYYHV